MMTLRERSRARRIARGSAKAQRGMTLLEIMIVLAIIALVMGFLVGPRILKMFGEAKTETAKTEAKQFAYEAYTQWMRNNKGCPSSLNDLLEYSNKKDIKDPWGADYIQHCGDNMPQGVKGGFGITSKGEDGKLNTTDDIHSWD